MAQQLYRTLTGSSQKSYNSKDDKPPTNGPVDLTKITTSNTQTGVLNHLSDEQNTLLERFKEKLQKDGWWSPDGINGKATHDDGTLLRYLRARKFDVDGAYGQFTDTEKWMKEQGVEDLYEHFDIDFYERARLMYPQWTGHRDRRGIPLYVYEIKGLDSKAVDKYQKEATAYKAKLPNHKSLSTPPKLMPLFALYHNLLNFVLPLCSTLERPNPEIPVTNSTNIVDISGVSLRQFWNLKTHMQDASVLATAHYPETLDRIFIIGAPSFFPTVWGWIKRWFDPVTVSKIFILGRNEVKPTLEKFMSPDSIPKKYGGNLDWRWGDIPDLDEEMREILEKDGNKGWVKGPALWLNNERVVVGSENGKLRRSDKEIAEKKPIIYAADYTEEPVHPEKRLSIVSGSKKSMDLQVPPTGANGKIVSDLPSPLPESPNTLVEDKQLGAPASMALRGATGNTTAAAAHTTETPVTEAATTEEARPVTPKAQQAPSHLNVEKIRTSPMGDSQVHLPDNQAAPPATTAEYITPTPSTVQVNAVPEPIPAQDVKTHDSVAAVAGAEAAATAAASKVPAHPPTSKEMASPPPGHAQPGPLPSHTTEVNRVIAGQLEKESTVTIPATANGVLPHPDIVVASDASKGLAMEADKMALRDAKHLNRPQPERFVTAQEIPQH